MLLGFGSLGSNQEKLGSKLGNNLAATLGNNLIRLAFSINPSTVRA
jgi:hypothetical protein